MKKDFIDLVVALFLLGVFCFMDWKSRKGKEKP